MVMTRARTRCETPPRPEQISLRDWQWDVEAMSGLLEAESARLNG